MSKFSVFIGRNDGGKSSAIVALHKLFQGQAFEDDDHRKDPVEDPDSEPVVAEEMQVRARMVDSDGAEYHYRCVRRLGVAGGPPDIAYELEQECVSETDLNQDFEALKLDQLKELCGEYNLQPTGALTKKDSFILPIRAYRDTLAKQTGWVPAPKVFRERLPRVFIYGEGSETDPEQTIKKTLGEFYRDALLPEYEAQLAKTREEVQLRLGDAASKYVPVIQEHCKTVEGISVDLGDTSFENVQIARVRVTQKGGAAIDWSRIGRGKRREMSLALFRFSSELLTETLERLATEESGELREIVALFDEPDTNLDYEAQRRVSQTLQKLATYDRCQVVVATHSVNVIDSVGLPQICFFAADAEDPDSPPVTRFDPGDEPDVLDMLRDSLGLRNSALFNEKLFVICEGDTEMAAFPLLYAHSTGSSLSLSGIYLINGQNNDGAKRVAGILRANRRAVHLVLDKDCESLSPYSKDNLSKAHINMDDVTFLGKTEFEDAFDDDVWVDVLNRHYPRNASPDWTLQDIADAHKAKKFSGYMVDTAIPMCSLARASKPDLGVHLARICVDTHRIPSEIVDLCRVIGQRAKGV